MPFISSVGHEIDVTLLDYVADKRVSTPTAAAIAAVPDKEEVYAFLDDALMRLKTRLQGLLRHKREILEGLRTRPIFVSPRAIYEEKQKAVAELGNRLNRGALNALERKSSIWESLSRQLSAFNPEAVTQRGYSISYGEDGKPITSLDNVEIGDILKTKLAHGIIVSEVKAKEE